MKQKPRIPYSTQVPQPRITITPGVVKDVEKDDEDQDNYQDLINRYFTSKIEDRLYKPITNNSVSIATRIKTGVKPQPPLDLSKEFVSPQVKLPKKSKVLNCS
mgnify:CR=1 FL=1